MSFVLSTEQIVLRDTVRDLLAARAGREARRIHVDDRAPYDADLWRQMASLGLHGLAIPEQYGGAGATLLDLCIVLEETGAALLCGPFYASAVLATTALVESGDTSAMADLLTLIAAGDVVATLAYRTPPSLRGEAVTATPTGAGWRLSGRAVHVVEGSSADLLLVFAQAPDGPALFAVTDTAVLPRNEAPALDPTRRLSDISFVSTAARLIGSVSDGADILRRTLAVAQVALAAEQVGGAQRCLDLTVEYATQRHQFGRPIGSFQAIKHRCADMFVDVQAARAATLNAAWLYDTDPAAFDAASRLTAALVSDAYYRGAAHSMQIHGAIAYTWEHDAHLYLKRAISSARLLHTPTDNRELTAAGLGL